METETPTSTGTVRLATEADTARIIELGWENAGDTKYRSHMAFDRDSLELFIGQVLADDMARLLVFEVGGTVQGVLAFQCFVNFYQYAGQLTASMIIWSVAPEHRGRPAIRLLAVAESEARKMGATRFILTGPGERFGKLCDHCGFEYLESCYVKHLEPVRQPALPFEVLTGAKVLEIDRLSQSIGNGPMVPYIALAAVARDDQGQPIGFVAARLVFHAGGSYVAPEHRGKGLARILRTMLEDSLAAGGVSRYFATPNTKEEADLFASYGPVKERVCQVKELNCH